MVENDISSVEYQLTTSTGPFDIPFYFIENGHIVAELYTQNGDDFNKTTLTIDVDYYLNGAGDQSGGQLTLLSAHSGATLLIYRDPDATQLTSYLATGKFPATSHERALDKLTMLIQRFSWWWDNLALKKPNFFAIYYDALYNRIRNLRDPSQAQDAATKNYVDNSVAGSTSHADTLFKRTIRVPESSINQFTSVAGRRNSLLGFNSNGNPVPIFSMTDTADLAIKLASNDIDLGASLVAAYGVGTVQDRLWDSVPLDAFLREADGNVDDALDLAVAYCAANNCNKIQLSSGKNYEIARNHDWLAYKNIKFIGDRAGQMQAGSGYSDGGTAAERAANPRDAAFLWVGPTATDWFTCGSQFTFDGVVFGAPGQNWDATSKSEIIDFGTAITGLSNLNVRSCVYYGMKNFVVGTGGSHYYENNVGFAMERDYQISNSRDINRIEDCHANPNVIRPDEAMWRCLISNSRTMITLTNHDGTMIHGCHTFCFKKAIVNKNASNYLGTLFLDRLHLDQTGCVLDNDTAGDGAIFFGKVDCIGDNASDAGTTTPDSDAGYIILRKTTNTLITPIYLFGVHCQAASSLVTSKPPFLINYQTSSGYVIHPLGVHCPEPTDNGGGTSCQMTGSITNSVRNFRSDPLLENLIPNPGWANRHPTNAQPLGWYFSNAGVSGTVSRTVTSTGSGGVFGVRFRQTIATRTYIITATSIGSSTGVTVTATSGSGVVSVYTGTWVKRGMKYYCIINASTTDVTHDIAINVGDSGQSVSFEYAAMTSGAQLNFGGQYTERQPKPVTTGTSSYSIQLATGASHTMYQDQAGTAGAYRLYISSAIGVAVVRLVKLNPTATPTITVEESAYAGTDTFSVSWPSNSNPVISSQGAGVLYLTLTGATYTA